MISSELLKIIVCPETRQALVLAEPELVDKINNLIENGWLKDRSGQVIEEKIEGGLIREDRKYLYPVRKGIPVLLIESSILLDSLS